MEILSAEEARRLTDESNESLRPEREREFQGVLDAALNLIDRAIREAVTKGYTLVSLICEGRDVEATLQTACQRDLRRKLMSYLVSQGYEVEVYTISEEVRLRIWWRP